jgi:hypothetical protein
MCSRIVLNLVSYFINIIYVYIRYKPTAPDKMSLVVTTICFVNLVTMSVLPVRYSEVSMELNEKICVLNDHYKQAKEKFRKTTDKVMTALFATIFLMGVLSSIESTVVDVNSNGRQNLASSIFYLICNIQYQYIYYLELTIYVTLIINIELIVKCLTKSINDAIHELAEINLDSGTNNAEIGAITFCTHGEDIELWSRHCQMLLACTKLLNKCFGYQVNVFIHNATQFRLTKESRPVFPIIIIISLLMTPLLGLRLSLWITYKYNRP